MKAHVRYTISLDPTLAQYVEETRSRLGITRSEVFVLALKRLRELELAQGYRTLAQDADFLQDPLLDSGLEETLAETAWG
ncbi:hypothetical protein [Thermus caliditerrae]|uniref:Ribbon-helix-helix protein, CopG family n=1 Tax=Thermus tengchongensis TaxID=1214928 RepID=A0A7V4EI63_9DEIN|nr:hypothetical protein [Thermus caliditerrae]